MANPFVAEIRIFPFDFAPQGWAMCNGQLLPISQNTALFSLLGTTYGGNGTSTFALPNLQGAVALHWGQGPGLSLYELGETAGTATVTLLQSEMPAHTHTIFSESDANNAQASSPSGAIEVNAAPLTLFSDKTSGLAQMNAAMISSAGGSQPHNNLMPYLTMNYCIALQGIYPTRS